MKKTVEVYVGIPAGLAAPLVYAGAVLIGGLLTPGYSQLSQTISELTAVGAPAARPLTNVFVAYNLLLGCFAVALPAILPTTRANLVTTAGATLMTVAIAGVGMSALFPVEGTGVAAEAASWKHVALAAVASFATMGAMLLWQSPNGTHHDGGGWLSPPRYASRWLPHRDSGPPQQWATVGRSPASRSG